MANTDEIDESLKRTVKNFRAMRARLEDGGPEVSYPLLVALEDGNLDAKERETVLRLIARYRTWFDAHLDMRCVVAGVEPPSTDESPQNHDSNTVSAAAQPPDESAQTVRHTSELKGDSTSGKLPETRKWASHASFALAATVLVAIGFFVLRNRGGWEPQYLAWLNDSGGVVALNKNGNLSGLESFPDQWQQRASVVLREMRFDVSPEVARLTSDVREQGTRSGDNPYAALISPVNTAIESNRPILKWRPPAGGADTYEVTIHNAAGKEVTRETVTETEWRVPESLLEHGQVYSWEITAIKDGERRRGPAMGIPAPKFQVLDRSAVEKIHLKERELESSHLLLSLFYVDAGLLDAAELELRALVASNPESELLRALLNSLDRQRRGST